LKEAEQFRQEDEVVRKNVEAASFGFLASWIQLVHANFTPIYGLKEVLFPIRSNVAPGGGLVRPEMSWKDTSTQ
jgi:hypothetical protein